MRGHLGGEEGGPYVLAGGPNLCLIWYCQSWEEHTYSLIDNQPTANASVKTKD